MKCLLCSSKFQDQKGLFDHYLSYYNVDAHNCFFSKIISNKLKAFLKNCVRCNEFITTDRHKRVHDFLKQYDEGKCIPFKEKPIDIARYPGLKIYSLEFKKYSSFYNFYDSENYVDDFLRNIKYCFETKHKKWFKCSFDIDNTQN